MESYAELVEKILKNEILGNAAKKMTPSEGLNLVCKNWLPCLKNDIRYQKSNHIAKSFQKSVSHSDKYDWEGSKKSLINVTVAGVCRFDTNEDNKKKNKIWVFINDSAPLMELAKVFTSDLGQFIEISDEQKFELKVCAGVGCAECRSGREFFEKRKQKIELKQPCIADTKIYDGDEILNRFKSQMEEMFSDTFVALVNVNIKSRYCYAEKETVRKLYRISGEIRELIGFNEAKLEEGKEVYLGKAVYEEMPGIDALKEIETDDGFLPSIEEVNLPPNKKRSVENLEKEAQVKKKKVEESSCASNSRIEETMLQGFIPPGPPADPSASIFDESETTGLFTTSQSKEENSSVEPSVETFTFTI